MATIEEMFRPIAGRRYETREELRRAIADLRMEYAPMFPTHFVDRDLFEYAFDHQLVRREADGKYIVVERAASRPGKSQ